MKKYKNLEERCRIISEKLLETIYLLEILEDFCESDAKAGTLISMTNEIEKCRKLISVSN